MLSVEFALIFIVLPLVFRLSPVTLPALPILWLAAMYCFVVLWRDATFDRVRLWKGRAVWPHLRTVITLFLVVGCLIVLGVRLFAPELLWQLVRQRPVLWAAIMVFYPIVSVYPQAVIYRAFLMHRYATLFQNPSMLGLVSAAAFGFLHVIFHNSLAIGMTFLGGLIFAWRYRKTGSLALSTLEHALYGCLLFTAGLGEYFYVGGMSWQRIVNGAAR